MEGLLPLFMVNLYQKLERLRLLVPGIGVDDSVAIVGCSSYPTTDERILSLRTAHRQALETVLAADEAIEKSILNIHEYVALKGVPVCKNFVNVAVADLWEKYVHTDFKTKKLLDPLKWTKSVMSLASDYVRRITELCACFDIALTQEEKELELVKYAYLEFLGIVVPQVKFSVNLAFNNYWQEIPPEGGPDDFLGMKLFPRRMSLRLKMMAVQPRSQRSFKSQTLMNTVFQGFKKGLLPVNPHQVQSTLDKHRKCLQKDPSISEELYSDIYNKATQLMKEWCPTSKRGMKDTLNQSCSATTQVPFGSGGNVGYVRDLLYGLPSVCPAAGAYVSGITTVITPEFMGFVTQKGKLLDPVPVFSSGPVLLSDVLSCYKFSFRNTIGARRVTDHVFRTCLEATPACILEPLKVRMITKPSVGLHVSMHKIQKSGWAYLYTYHNPVTGFRPFRLIGEPLQKEHLKPLMDKLVPGAKIVSGDYSAATDNLKGEVTLAIWDAVADKFDFTDDEGDNDYPEMQVLYQNIRNSLTGMEILQSKTILPSYEEFPHLCGFRYKLQDFTQLNGQLMGHVLSFILLCIANACALWRAAEEYMLIKLSFWELMHYFPFYVNGDDITFVAPNDDMYNIWMTVIRQFGFEPSIGKNFCNDKFLQINSELYRVDKRPTDGAWDGKPWVKDFVKIPYINFGLITNRAKNDCSKDQSVQRIGLKSRGEIEQDSLLGRLKAAPGIYSRLTQDLPAQLAEVAQTLYRKHNETAFRNFGLVGLAKDLDDPAVGAFWQSYVVKNCRNVDSDKLQCFNDLSMKLDRGELDFEHKNVKRMLKDMKLPLDLSIEEIEWVKC